MDRYLLKNIIIIILVLANGFLLGSLALRQTAETQARRQREEQLVALFTADEIALDADAISDQDPPNSLSFMRNTVQEQEAAVFFLGSDVIQEDQGGGIVTYTGPNGTATFRSNGSFDMKGVLVLENAEALCEKFCRSLDYDTPMFFEAENGTAIGRAACLYNNLPVVNGSITFTLEDGTLTAVSGTLLPKEALLNSQSQEPLSAPAALIAFQKMRRESITVVSAVTQMYPCYELQSTTASSLSLVPVWCIVTDIANYYVNCITGAVTSS